MKDHIQTNSRLCKEECQISFLKDLECSACFPSLCQHRISEKLQGSIGINYSFITSGVGHLL
jgi:hypothetical protein